LRNQYLFD